MATLPTNFKDDILDASVNQRRRYNMITNPDGTIELEDVTEYSQVGDVFGAGQINSTNTEVNKKFDKNMLVRDLDTINAITKEGYAPDALALKDVNDSLGNFVGFIDTSRKLTTITTKGTSWTATEDCYVTGYLTCNGVGVMGNVYVNDVVVAGVGSGGSTSTHKSYSGLCVPVKKGQVVKTRSGDNFEYNISVYAMQK